jgi:ribosomal-protein-alanine N-acetyltransferase
MLRSERLALRPLELADLDALHELAGDPVVMRYIGDGLPLARDRTELWITNAAALYTSRGLGTHAIFAGDTFIGFCGVLTPEHGELEIIWGLHPRHHGRGFATEAVRAMLAYAGQLGIERVIATIHPDNVRSIAVAERVGLAREGERLDAYGVPEIVYACDPRR